MARPTQKQIDAHYKRIRKTTLKKTTTAAFDVCEELRSLAEKQPKRETVLLPMCKANDWWNCGVEVDFEPVKISKLLLFIADMIE